MKENITNKAPEGYVFDKENSDLENGIVIWKHKSKVSYKEISRVILSECGSVCNLIFEYNTMNGTEKKRDLIHHNNIKKVLACNKLLNIATYLNEGWKPDLDNNYVKCYYIGKETNITYDKREREKTVKYVVNDYNCYLKSPVVALFKDRETAERAIEIMGDDINYLFD